MIKTALTLTHILRSCCNTLARTRRPKDTLSKKVYYQVICTADDLCLPLDSFIDRFLFWQLVYWAYSVPAEGMFAPQQMESYGDMTVSGCMRLDQVSGLIEMHIAVDWHAIGDNIK